MKSRSLIMIAQYIVAAVAMVTSAMSQEAPRLAQKFDATQRHVLNNTVPPQTSIAKDQGQASGELPMKDMVLMLKPSEAQSARLTKLVDDLHNSSSAKYHQWLTPEEFGAQFGPSEQDIQTISQWLQANGFKVEQVSRSKSWIRFSGSASQVESSFQTSIHQFSDKGATRYANTTNISIPEGLFPVVSGVLSLNNFPKRALHTDLHQVARAANGKLTRVAATNTAMLGNSTAAQTATSPDFTTGGTPQEIFLAPNDFAKIYGTHSLIADGTDGEGVSIAIVGRSDISLSDVESFRTVFKLPPNDPTITYATDDPGVVPGDDEEAILDVEWSGAVAPKAKINYVIGASTTSTDGVDISASYIVDNVVAPIMSVSFGQCEARISPTESAFYNSLWQQAAAEGITVFVSSGDAGSSACDIPNQYIASPYGLGVNGLASTPFNVAVGGTEFNDSNVNTYWNLSNDSSLSSAKGYVPEAVWNESCNPNLPVGPGNCYFSTTDLGTYAAGGGASSCAIKPDGATQSIFTGLYSCQAGFTKPSWQTGPGVPSDGVRDLPDVSLAAAAVHDGFLLCYNGSCQWTKNNDGSITLHSASIIGGTSASSPSMAGIMALVEQRAGQFQGQANYQLYKLASQPSASCDSSTQTDPTATDGCIFHDVTSGTNTLSCVKGRTDCTVTIAGNSSYGLLTGYGAQAGYDLASGLGSVNAANLVNAWSNLSHIASTTTLAVSAKSFPHGTPVTVTETVAPESGSGTPSGEVVLLANGATSNNGSVLVSSLASGSYSGSVNSLPGGTYSLSAKYGGDATYSGSTSSPISLTVTPEPSTATGTTYGPSRFFILGRRPIVQLTSVPLGTPFYISVKIAGASGAGIATGSIALSDGTKTFGTYPLDKTGSIYIACGPGTECDYPIGSYTFTATYSGDSSFNANTTSVPFTILKGSVNYALTLNTQTPPANSQVVATVYFGFDPAVKPTGTVTIKRQDTGTVFATGTIDATGNATVPFIAPAGTYWVIAAYSGDANYTAGVLQQYPQIITTGQGTATTTTSIVSGATSAVLGQKTQFTIAVVPGQSSQNAISGTVTLYDNNGPITPAIPLAGGKASPLVEWDFAGPRTIYASYSGNASFSGSSSTSIAITVSPAKPNLMLQGSSTYAAGQSQTSISAFLTSVLSATQVAAPTGSVQFYDSVAGRSATPIGVAQAINLGNRESLLATIAPQLSPGAHVITARYSGDANWTAATAAPILCRSDSAAHSANPPVQACTPLPGGVQ